MFSSLFITLDGTFLPLGLNFCYIAKSVFNTALKCRDAALIFPLPIFC